jgi:metal-responsive CopG/Arc/MetJ family transcriptional regulator
MQTLSHTSPQRTPTTEMEVTSIRLERDLKERLKHIAGRQGYQALIRDVLWDYVRQQEDEGTPSWSREDIRVSITAIAQQEQHCALTGTSIHPQEEMVLGLTTSGEWIPIHKSGLDT